MNVRPLFVVCMFLAVLSSCDRYSYIQSPLHTNTNSYKTIALHSEDVKSATYASGLITGGSAGDNLHDNNVGFIGSLYRSHNFGHFQGYYGVTGSLGSYRLKYNPLEGDSMYQRPDTHKFYGSWGANGGINFVLPFNNGSEWRVMGAEFSWNREFGEFADLRSKVKDSLVDIIDRHRDYATLSFNSDFVFHVRKGSIGYKFGYVTSLRALRYIHNPYRGDITPGYFSQTFHFTRERVTGFWQLNFGTYALGSQLGISYRL